MNSKELGASGDACSVCRGVIDSIEHAAPRRQLYRFLRIRDRHQVGHRDGRSQPGDGPLLSDRVYLSSSHRAFLIDSPQPSDPRHVVVRLAPRDSQSLDYTPPLDGAEKLSVFLSSTSPHGRRGGSLEPWSRPTTEGHGLKGG